MLIGTAGHIDHGKTTLVRALTGVDTDRLPEEKRRGITIELGYAYLPVSSPTTGGDEVIGFVDVPGHEKFIPTMLAGASGVDFALLVVAADDGPMPQTREHLQILQLLGLTRGAVALTKVDRVDGERLSEVTAQVHALLATTGLAGAPVFPVCALNGTGVADLRQYLQAVACQQIRHTAPHESFRLAVDRVFTLPGVGTIVAGSIHTGQVRVGDTVHLAPGGQGARVRNLHVQNRKAGQGHAGQRCALNLAGLGVDEAKRGDWLTSEPALPSTQRLDMDLTLSGDASRPLVHGAAIQLHHGTRHLLGRVALLDARLEKSGLAPGQRGLAQIVVDSPMHACRGDLVVLRDGHGQHTLGGGHILDPFGPSRHRRSPERLAQLSAQAIPDATERLPKVLALAPFGLELSRLAAAENLASNNLLALLPDSRSHAQADWIISSACLEDLAVRVEKRLTEHHENNGDERGLERDRLRRMIAPALPPAAFAEWLEEWLAKGRLERSGSAWHLPGHRVELEGRDRLRADRLLPWLLDAPFDPPWVRDIAARLGEQEAQTRELLKRLAAQGEVCQVVRDLFYAPAAIRNLGQIASGLMTEEGCIRAAAFRDRSGLGRKRAIQILEYFDRIGFTRKVGRGHEENHRIRGDLPVN
ncbi:selenocysteine-specific translation elongation factor [Zoogloea sp.]|uniref:selenocysteine-specific translation elongation factor n=1 Tax=Zoogloea sp. TaxID=49181 RepID=UPI00260486E9|nr:selenocysteine-specific translation elongation factor [Zoogloea sp.]MDD3352947.1 selenocysteine-specific translation elongation factor [Zoogloea sp.]